jgi:hypothetical protein
MPARERRGMRSGGRVWEDEMSESQEIRVPESVGGWPRRRIEHAIAVAVESDSAVAWHRLTNLAAALGCLEIARFAHARSRDAMTSAEPKRLPRIDEPARVEMASQSGGRASGGSRQVEDERILSEADSKPQGDSQTQSTPRARTRNKGSAKHSTPLSVARPVVLPAPVSIEAPSFDTGNRHRVRVRSAIPRARSAWFERWAAARGLSVDRRGDDFVVAASPRASAALDDLRDHPEFEISVEV